MKKYLHHYWIAQSFLTRLPVPDSKAYSDKEMGRSVLYYPLVGTVVAIILSFIAWALSFSNPLLVAVIITTLWVTITGALHLDGLADTADAWLGGHGNKERIFTIMKDPRSGTAGVSAIVLVLMLKVTALMVLIEQSNWMMIFLIPIIARLAASSLIFLLPSAKEEGLAYVVKKNLPISDAFALLLVISIVIFLLSPSVFIFTALIFFALRWMMLKQIGGMTGDTLGASVEIIEAMGLMFAALLV